MTILDTSVKHKICDGFGRRVGNPGHLFGSWRASHETSGTYSQSNARGTPHLVSEYDAVRMNSVLEGAFAKTQLSYLLPRSSEVQVYRNATKALVRTSWP